MRRIRIGKDINIKWELHAPSDIILTTDNLTVELKDPKGRSFQCEYVFDTSVAEGYVVVVSLIGKRFNILGNYTLSAWLNKGKSGQSVVDAVNAFTLVESTLSEDKTKECGCGHLVLETVDIQSDFFFIGLKGEKGEEGFSPVINTTKSGTTTTVHIQDKYGEKSFLIKDGEKGEKGEQGERGEKGERGEQGLQGIQGVQGERGEQGIQGIQGERGLQGVAGQDGADGQDGYSPTVSLSKSGKTTTLVITDKNGEHTATITDGNDGQNGADGRDGTNGTDGINGTDGVSPTVSINKINGVTTITITDKNGVHTATINDGQNGADGTDGINGTDGQDGVSPAVTVDTIQGGHQVTITDAEHPQGQSFNVMDGQDAPAVQEIFWATYNTTTATEIQTALDAGKTVMCKRGTFIYTLTDNNDTAFRFFSFYNICTFKSFSVAKSNNAWSGISTHSSLLTNDKISSTTSTLPDDNKVYSALATKNLIEAVDAKIGPAVSFTYTYTDDTTQTYNLLTSNNS